MRTAALAGLAVIALVGSATAQKLDAVKFGIPIVWAARIGTAYYYAFFWIIMPVVGLIENPKSLPDSIAKSVLGAPAAAPAD